MVEYKIRVFIVFEICSQIPTKIGREKRAVISWIHSRRSIANDRSMPGLPLHCCISLGWCQLWTLCDLDTALHLVFVYASTSSNEQRLSATRQVQSKTSRKISNKSVVAIKVSVGRMYEIRCWGTPMARIGMTTGGTGPGTLLAHNAGETGRLIRKYGDVYEWLCHNGYSMKSYHRTAGAHVTKW